MFIFKAHQRRKGLNLCALCIWAMRKALELDTPGPPFVCFKPTESKSIYGGCSRAWCPCSRGDLLRPRHRTERLNAQNHWNIASRPPANSGSMPQLSSRTLSFSRGQAESPNHNIAEFPCCPGPWWSADEVCQRHLGFKFMSLLLTLSKSSVHQLHQKRSEKQS